MTWIIKNDDINQTDEEFLSKFKFHLSSEQIIDLIKKIDDVFIEYQIDDDTILFILRQHAVYRIRNLTEDNIEKNIEEANAFYRLMSISLNRECPSEKYKEW